MDYIGKLLDHRYEIQEVIGTGGMAVVYKALCHRLNRLVAVKILKEEYRKDAEFRRRFHTESQAVGMLSHPNIVSVYDVSHTEQEDYIVMELIDGITLKQYLEQKGTLNWREALHFAIQIGKALEHAHSRGIVHRDIKPHNIMILKDGSIKVADFGIARMTSSQSTLTREALGSVHYISPEQAKGGKVDCRSDLYSLGVVLYETLTGRPPYDGDTPVSVAIQHINGKATMPRELNPSIPKGLEQITMRAMETDMDARYASAAELLADLERFRQDPTALFESPKPVTAAPPVVQKKPEPVKVPAAEKKKEPAKKTKTAWIAGIACVAVAVAGFVLLLLYLLGDWFTPGEELVVPDFSGKSAEVVLEEYREDFTFEENWVFDESLEYGLILDQEPKAEKTVKRGAAVKLKVSLGLQQMSMPNLINYPVEKAMEILSGFKADLHFEQIEEESDIYVENYIIRTEPFYGAPLVPGDTVILYVSSGASAELIAVPALIGMDVEEAVSLLEERGLSRGSIKYVDSDLPKGTVTFQSIEQEEMVREKTVINLQASLGTEDKAQVPSIEVQPASAQAEQNTSLLISVTASVADGGTVTYEWFRSESGSGADLQPVGHGSSYRVPTDTIGSCSYCCKITNTLGESTASIYTNMAKVTVTEKLRPVTRTLELTIPEGTGEASVVVKLDGANYTTPFTVDRAAGTVEIPVEATGTHVVDVYVDGLLTLSRSVTFTE